MKYISLSLLLLICSCASKKIDSKEDYQVLNAYLAQNKDSIIFNTTSLSLNQKKPEQIFQGYLSLSKRFKKFRTKEEFFSKNEIADLKNKYPNWVIKVWDTTLIKINKIKYVKNFKNKTFDLTKEEIQEISYLQKWIFTISKPFYNRQRKKALLLIKREKNHDGQAGGLILVEMKKVNSKWMYNASSPF